MRLLRTLCFVPVLLAAVLVAQVDAADEVSKWNGVMLEVAALPVPPATTGTNPLTMSRNAAIVQSAVFEAINGIERRFTSILPTRIQARAPRTASKDAAVMQAAYASLVRLYSTVPNALSILDTARASSLAHIASTEINGSGELIQQGISFGQQAADAVWEWRKNDGIQLPPGSFNLSGDPGVWAPTPPANVFTGYPQFATMTPWVMLAHNQFLPPPPPALTSSKYAMDFAETKNTTNFARNGNDPEDLLNDRKAAALFWNAGTASAYWDRVALAFADRDLLSQSERARLLGLVNLAVADAAIGCWDAKYTYVFWRPIAAIPAVQSGWTTLVNTPTHPEYPSGHSCLSGAAVRVLKSFFGDSRAFELGANLPATGIRQFDNFSDALEEVKNARIWAGIHFRSATEVGTTLGSAVAEYVLDNAMLPVKSPGVGQLTK